MVLFLVALHVEEVPALIQFIKVMMEDDYELSFHAVCDTDSIGSMQIQCFQLHVWLCCFCFLPPCQGTFPLSIWRRTEELLDLL